MRPCISKVATACTVIVSFFYFTAATSCEQKINEKKLHQWAVQSHKEFWTMLGKSAGYRACNEKDYQYVRSINPSGLNYLYLAKSYQTPDFLINQMKDRIFTLFCEADDDEHIFKYITRLEESDDFITMALDLKNLSAHESLRPDIRVWKVITDAEFDEWLSVTATRGNLKEDLKYREYFQNFKPSKGNSSISFYLGSINKKIVGGSLIFFSKDFASLYWVSVHPKYRRQGLGKALSYYPLKEAIQRGYRWSVLQAQPLGLPVYLKLGFIKVGKMKVFYYIDKDLELHKKRSMGA